MTTSDPTYVAVPRRALVVLAFAAVVAALAVPAWAGPAARTVFVLAAAVVAAGGAVALVRAVPFAPSSRFQPAERVRERRDVPPELENLLTSVRESNKDGGRQVLTPTVLLHLRRIATARLAAMRLDVDDPADHPAIQRHVSMSMWAVLAPGRGAGRAQQLPSLEVPASSLPALLDELERL